MKLKKTFISVITATMLFSACASPNSEKGTVSEVSEIRAESVSEAVPLSETSSQTEAETETSETAWENPALAPTKLASRNLSDFTITGNITLYDEVTHTSTYYSGEITDEDDIDAVLEFIAFTESVPVCRPHDYYSSYDNTESVSLQLKDDEHGGFVWYNETSFTENGEDSGYILRSGNYDSLCIPVSGSPAPLFSLMEDILVKEENIKSQVTYPVDSYKKGAVLICEYRNWAWGYQHCGYIIDINGNVYPFDFSDDQPEDEVRSEEELIDRLMKIYAESKPESSQYKKYKGKLKEITKLADKADKRARLISESDAYDSGQSTVYAITSDFRLITVCSSGDSAVTSTDENALEIQKLLNEMNIN